MESLEDYNYNLPKEFIAQEQAKPRTHSKLMVVKKNGDIVHDRFYNIINYLEKDDVLVINDSKVVKAKLTGKKETGGKIELLMENHNSCMVKGHVQKGTKIIFENGIIGEITEKNGAYCKIKFNKPVDEIIKEIGQLPLPPYIKKKIKSDSEYQTVYSKKEGSLAAPTAGLHFDEELLKKIKQKGIKISRICLHVSFSTFLPIKETDFTKHKMHAESFEISKESADLINNRKGRLFVVGTTSLRALETAADKKGIIHPGKSISKIFIYPGYKFKNKIDGMITNFHLPKSTLLLLVSALFGREKIFKAYEEAKKNNYRFFSLGDAMLLLLNENSQPQ